MVVIRVRTYPARTTPFGSFRETLFVTSNSSLKDRQKRSLCVQARRSPSSGSKQDAEQWERRASDASDGPETRSRVTLFVLSSEVIFFFGSEDVEKIRKEKDRKEERVV